MKNQKTRSKHRFVLSLCFVILINVLSVNAQNDSHLVKGIVTSSEGEVLPFTNVYEKSNPTKGTVSTLDGIYSLKVTGDTPVLVFSSLGFEKQEISVNGRGIIDVVLSAEMNNLDVVVVTAMGIKRQAREISSATQQIGGEELKRSKDVNFVNSLHGKSAGLTVTPNSSGAGGGSSKILLRGQTSIWGNNQPLIVLDGIPLANGMTKQTTDLEYGGASDGGDLLSMINPDDIEDVTILKGANAAALYGSAANNGVIIITTKGAEKGVVKVEASTNLTIETPFIVPEIQKKYGGNISNSGKLNFDGWGKRLEDYTDDEMYQLPYATRKPHDNIKDFFQAGITQNYSVSLRGGTEKITNYFSYSHTKQRGIIENNNFARHNLLLKQSYKVGKKVSVDISINYIQQKLENPPTIGKTVNPLYPTYRAPANVDMRYFKENYQHIATADDPMVKGLPETVNEKLIGQNVQTWDWFTQNNNNPYWIINKRYSETIKDRILASATVKAEIIPELLNVQGRMSIDNKSNENKGHAYATLNRESRSLGGEHNAGNRKRTDLFADVLTTLNKKVGNIDLSIIGGVSAKKINSKWKGYRNYIDRAGIVNLFQPWNSIRNVGESSVSAYHGWGNDWEGAIFGTTTIGFNEKAHIDASYRRDWSLAFQQFAEPGKYKSYGYYSLSGNIILHKLIPSLSNYCNNMKLRGSYSIVGNSIPNEIFNKQIIRADGSVSARKPKFDNPMPETTESIELGLETSLLDAKLSVDFTVYQATMSHMFVYRGASNGTEKPTNSGVVRNQGIELTTRYTVADNASFKWDTQVNFAWNDNEIIETFKNKNGVSQKMSFGPKAFKIKYLKGKPYGDLYVNSFVKNEKGEIILDNDGAPRMETSLYKTNVGNTIANINLGFNNTFSYKDWTLNFLINGKIGGKVMSLTESDLDLFGLSQRTSDARDNGGVKVNAVQNEKPVSKIDAKLFYQSIGKNPNEYYVYDATSFKLKELSLSYMLKDALGKSKNLSVSLMARNLCYLYKNSPVDPDISMTAANGFGGIDIYALPTTRTMGMSVKVTF